MKSLRRYFCVLLSCVLLLGAFSVTAKAEEVDVGTYTIYAQSIWQQFGDSNTSLLKTFTFTPNNGTQEKLNDKWPVAINTSSSAPFVGTGTVEYYITKTDKSAIARGGIDTTIILENVTLMFTFANKANTSSTGRYGASALSAVLYYKDNTYEYASVTKTDRGQGVFDLRIDCKPSKDVVKIMFSMYNRPMLSDINPCYDYNSTGNYYVTQYSAFLGEMNSDKSFVLKVNQPSEEAGLLSGILGWIENIWNTVTDGFTDMKNGITNIVNKIIELPSLLWEKIETGLKNLFVPDDEYIVGYKDRWDELLADRLGAVYEVVNVTFESWEDINVSDATNTVDMPKVTIPLPDDEEFSFGGFPVKIVPDGFETLVTACKLIVGIVCTIMFVNGLRKRYDEVMGVEQ